MIYLYLHKCMYGNNHILMESSTFYGYVNDHVFWVRRAIMVVCTCFSWSQCNVCTICKRWIARDILQKYYLQEKSINVFTPKASLFQTLNPEPSTKTYKVSAFKP